MTATAAAAGRKTRLSAETQTTSEATTLPPLVYLYLGTLLLPVVTNLGPVSLSSLRLLCLCVTLPLLVAVLGGRYGRVMWADWLAVVHVAWMGLSFFATEGTGAIELTGSMGVEFLGGYLIARSCIRSLAQFQAMCRILVLTTLVLAPLALAEAVTGTSPLLMLLGKLPAVGTLEIIETEMRLNLHRVQSVFAHPIHFGLYASVCFALCWTALAPVMGRSQRLVLAGFIAAAGFLSLSSGGILAIALQVALIAWTVILPAKTPRWWILLGLFVLAYLVIDLLSNRTPIRVFMSYATFSAHTANWRLLIMEHGLANVWANPLWGLGLKDWVRPIWMHTPSVDNFWLLNAMRNGVLGFVTLAACWIAVLVPAMRAQFDADTPLGRARRAWVFVILGLCFTLLTVHVWGNTYSFVMFLLGMGAWFATAREGVETETAQPKIQRAPLRRHTRFPAPNRPARA